MTTEENLAVDGLRSLTFTKTLTRALTLRCPACGIGKLFRSLFRMNSGCSSCDFRFERPAGYFLGSTYINYGVTAVLTTVSYVTLYFGFGWAKQTLLPGLLLFCGVFPLVFFRFARSLWLSFDCLFDRLGANEAVAETHQTELEKRIQK